ARRVAWDRQQRARRYAAELALLPPAERGARLTTQAAEEGALRALEDARVRDEEIQKANKARYANWPRERILLLASVLATGPSPNAISLEGFLDKAVETAGQNTTYTPRFGLE